MDYGAAFGSALAMVGVWVILGFLGAIPTIILFRWWSEGTIGAVEGLGLLAMYGVLFALFVSAATPGMKAVTCILLLGACGGLPIMARSGARRTKVELEDEQEMTYRAAIEKNPKNGGAPELAMNLYGRGRVSEAIEEMEYAIQLSPQTTENEQYRLKVWLRDQAGRPKETAICRWCREETPLDRPRCVQCNRPLNAAQEVAEAVIQDIPGIVRGLLLLLPALLLAAFILSMMNGILGILLMLVLVVGGLWWVRHQTEG